MPSKKITVTARSTESSKLMWTSKDKSGVPFGDAFNQFVGEHLTADERKEALRKNLNPAEARANLSGLIRYLETKKDKTLQKKELEKLLHRYNISTAKNSKGDIVIEIETDEYYVDPNEGLSDMDAYSDAEGKTKPLVAVLSDETKAQLQEFKKQYQEVVQLLKQEQAKSAKLQEKATAYEELANQQDALLASLESGTKKDETPKKTKKKGFFRNLFGLGQSESDDDDAPAGEQGENNEFLAEAQQTAGQLMQGNDQTQPQTQPPRQENQTAHAPTRNVAKKQMTPDVIEHPPTEPAGLARRLGKPSELVKLTKKEMKQMTKPRMYDLDSMELPFSIHQELSLCHDDFGHTILADITQPLCNPEEFKGVFW